MILISYRANKQDLSKETQKKLADGIATGDNEGDNQPISMKTIISSGEEMRELGLYGFLGKRGAKKCRKHYVLRGEMSISKHGRGRTEMTQALTKSPVIQAQGKSGGYKYNPSGEGEE